LKASSADFFGCAGLILCGNPHNLFSIPHALPHHCRSRAYATPLRKRNGKANGHGHRVGEKWNSPRAHPAAILLKLNSRAQNFPREQSNAGTTVNPLAVLPSFQEYFPRWPIPMQLQRVCDDTLPWLISFSLIWLWICQRAKVLWWRFFLIAVTRSGWQRI